MVAYTVQRMITDFETNADSATKLDMIVDPGTAYVNGYRSQIYWTFIYNNIKTKNDSNFK